MAFRYWIIYTDGRHLKPSTIFAINREGHRLDTISWSHVNKAWRHDPSVLSYLFSGDSQDAKETTRDEAEQVAQQLGIQPLPNEEELKRISDEAEARRPQRGVGGPPAQPNG